MTTRKTAFWIGRSAAYLASLVVGAAAPAHGAPNACPAESLLAITGLVKPNSPSGAYVFSEQDFLKLKTTKLTTSTAWTPKSEFVGPELATVLAAAGASPEATELHFYAIDAYESVIPMSDLAKYHPVMAHTQNGQRLDIPARGPVFLVYPRDQHPELPEGKYVWMVCKIDVR